MKYERDSYMNRFAAGDCCEASGVAIPIGIVHCGLRGRAVGIDFRMHHNKGFARQIFGRNEPFLRERMI